MMKRVSLSRLKSTLVRRRSRSRDRTLGTADSTLANNQRSESASDSSSPRGENNLLKLLKRWKKKKKRNSGEPELQTTEENAATDVVVPITLVAKKLRSKSEIVSPNLATPILRSRADSQPLENLRHVSAQGEFPSSQHQQLVPVMVVTSEKDLEEACSGATASETNIMHLCPGNLMRELFKLSRCGWYWGPISRQEAEEKLIEQGDGAFLVRDSSDDHYLLSLSFRSYGHILHTRIEHCNGLFSFYSEPEPEGHSSIVQLIEQSMSYSQSGVFCYSRGRTPNSPSYPVRLTKPVSRFNQVRTLQYLCRFVIRQYTRFDHIQKLPLPGPIKGYLEEGHY